MLKYMALTHLKRSQCWVLRDLLLRVWRVLLSSLPYASRVTLGKSLTLNFRKGCRNSRFRQKQKVAKLLLNCQQQMSPWDTRCRRGHWHCQIFRRPCVPRVGPARVKEIIRLTHVLSPPICLGHQIHWDNLCSRVAQEMVFWLPGLELLFMVWSFMPSVPKKKGLLAKCPWWMLCVLDHPNIQK